MRRGGRLVLGIGLLILAALIGLWGRIVGWQLTEGELFVALWPAWLLALGLVAVAGWLLGKR